MSETEAKAVVLYARDGYQLDVCRKPDGDWLTFRCPKKTAVFNAAAMAKDGGVIASALREFLEHLLT